MMCVNYSTSADFTSQFKENLEKSQLFSKILCLEQTGSTNDDVRTLLTQTGKSPVCVLAQLQTSGRGTHGRVWSNMMGSILLSVGGYLQRPVQEYAGVTLAVGAYIVRALRTIGCGVYLKWPNDIWFSSGKAGGILTEIVSCGEGRAIVVGVGVNITVPQQITAPKGCVATGIGVPIGKSRADIATVIAISAMQAVNDFNRAVLVDISDDWSQLDAFYGKTVIVMDEAHIPLYQAISCGLTQQGALMVRREDGEVVHLISGSVRLVPEGTEVV